MGLNLFSSRRAVRGLTALFVWLSSGCSLPLIAFRDGARTEDISDASVEEPRDDAGIDVVNDLRPEDTTDVVQGEDVRDGGSSDADATLLDARVNDVVDAEDSADAVDVVAEDVISEPSPDVFAVDACSMNGARETGAEPCTVVWDASAPSMLTCAEAFAADRMNCGRSGNACARGEYCDRCECKAAAPSLTTILRVDDFADYHLADEVSALEFGPEGELYVTGNYQGFLRIGGTRVLVRSMPSDAARRMWIARVERGGAVAWAQDLGSVEAGRRTFLEVGDDGNIYVGGTAEHFVGGGVTVRGLGTTTPPFSHAMFVASLSRDGTGRWIRLIEEDQDLELSAMTLRSDGVLVLAGRAFAGGMPPRFDPVFAAVSASSGCVQWHWRGTHTASICRSPTPPPTEQYPWAFEALQLNGISETADRSVLVSGLLCGSLALQCQSGRAVSIDGSQVAGGFAIRISANGTVSGPMQQIYSRSTTRPPPNPPAGRFVRLAGSASDRSGNVYFVGEFAADLLGFGTRTTMLPGTGNPQDILLTSLNAMGGAGPVHRALFTIDNDSLPVLHTNQRGELLVGFSSGGNGTIDSFGGSTPVAIAGGQAWVLSYALTSAEGSLRWAHAFRAAPVEPNQREALRAVTAAEDGSIAVAGFSRTEPFGMINRSSGTQLLLDGRVVLAPTATNEPLNSFIAWFAP